MRQAAGADDRIVLLMQDFRGGGAERMFIRLANGFAAKGCAVSVVAVHAEGMLIDEIAAEVDVVDLGCARTINAIRPLRTYLERVRPAALLSGLVHMNTLAVLATRTLRPRPRLVLSERNTPSRDVFHSGSAMVFAAHVLIPWAYRQADAIVAVSNGVADDLARMALLSRRRIDVLPNPVVPEDFAALLERPLDFEWPESDDRPVVLAAGRLHAQKDFATLLRAVAEVAEPVCEVLILGEGEERAHLEHLATTLGLHGRVHLPGFSKSVPAAVRRADLFVLSSRFEGSPNVLVEAMAAGTPVIATDCRSGPREILDDGRLGPLVPVGDSKTLSGAIAKVLATPTPASQLQARAADYAVGRSIDGYLAVLRGAPAKRVG